MKIAVFCPNWVGDMVMATAALRAIRRHFSQAEIVAVVRPYVADVLDGLDLVDRRLLHDPWNRAVRLAGHSSQATRSWQFARRLRAERFDVALVLPNSFRSAFWAFASGARRRIGFARDGRACLLTDPVAPRPRNIPHPVLDEYLRLAKRLGCRQLTRKMELATNSDDDRRLEAFWESRPAGQFAERGVVCLNPGGAFGAAKHWPVTSFAQLALRLALERDKRVLVLCGPAEQEEARQIVRLARHPAVVSLADESPSIGLTKSAIRRAELLVTTDSGPRHFAAPFQVPVVTLFGPTHPAWSETYYERALHLQVEVDCGPCQERVCPASHHRCMRDLSVGWAFKAAATLLDSFPAKSKAA
jgi:heptosyltransferase-2